MRDVARAVARVAEAAVALRRARADLADRPEMIEDMLVVGPPPSPTAHAQARDVRAAVGRAARLLRLTDESTCLVRAVAGYRMLARRRVVATLCLGHAHASAGGRGGAPFTAHAWLELDGVAVLGEPSPTRFTRPSGGVDVRSRPA